MGDFILYNKDDLALDKVKQAVSCIEAQGSHNPTSVEHGPFKLLLYPKQISPVENIFQDDHGNFCGSSGTFLYKNQMGIDALKALLHDFSPEKHTPENFSGIFTIILKKKDRLFILTDPMGGNRVYQNDRACLWTSSFLTAAKACTTVTPNQQAVYEYAFQETTYGTDTVFQEVNTLDAQKLFEVTLDGLRPFNKAIELDFSPSNCQPSDLVDETVDILRQTVKPVTQIFGDKIRTALSGGYDSRLMLALLKDSSSSPEVYVYGPDNSPDVTVARTIAHAQGFTLDHIDKGKTPFPDPERYSEIIQDNFFSLDGLPGESIFDFGANMSTRRARAGQNNMVFNGGGGEIFRNFFYLPNRSFSINDVIDCFYSRYCTALCQPDFDETLYRDNLHAKIKMALGTSSDQLSRTEVEYAYPAFRLRYWTSRDNNNNTRLGSYLTPFITYKMIRQALTIPLNEKNHGTFQAALIKSISPELAAFPSDYGYAFDQDVPTMVKVKNWMTYLRPTFLRRYSYALQHRMGELALPKTLEPGLIEAILPDGTPHMSRYFNIEAIKDSGMLSRIYTMEYLFQHFGL